MRQVRAKCDGNDDDDDDAERERERENCREFYDCTTLHAARRIRVALWMTNFNPSAAF